GPLCGPVDHRDRVGLHLRPTGDAHADSLIRQQPLEKFRCNIHVVLPPRGILMAPRQIFAAVTLASRPAPDHTVSRKEELSRPTAIWIKRRRRLRTTLRAVI